MFNKIMDFLEEAFNAKVINYILFEYTISIIIQTILTFLFITISTGFFDKEKELEVFLNQMISKSNAFALFVPAILLIFIFGVFTVFKILLGSISKYPSRKTTKIEIKILEEIPKTIISVGGFVAGVLCASTVFLIMNPKHSAYEKLTILGFAIPIVILLFLFYSTILGYFLRRRIIEKEKRELRTEIRKSK